MKPRTRRWICSPPIPVDISRQRKWQYLNNPLRSSNHNPAPMKRERKLRQFAALLSATLSLGCGVTNSATARTITVTPKSYHGELLGLAPHDRLQLLLAEDSSEIWWILKLPPSIEPVVYRSLSSQAPKSSESLVKQIILRRTLFAATGPQTLTLALSHPIWGTRKTHLQIRFEFQDPSC
jgi:hypothetical protein